LTFEVTGPDLNPGKYIDVSRAAAAGLQPGKKNSEEDVPGWPPPPGTNNAVSSDSSAKTFFKHHLTQKDSVLYDKPAAEITLQMTKGT
jgi:hypothetical protein